MIPRAVLFGNADRDNVQLSPDGRFLSYIAPEKSSGVMNVHVAITDALDTARAVTHDRGSGIYEYRWACGGDAILYRQDAAGDENFNIFRVDLATGESTNLTPNPRARALIHAVSDHRPGEVLVRINDRDPALFDLVRIDLRTGRAERVAENPGAIPPHGWGSGFVTDEQHRLRYLTTVTDDGGMKFLQPAADGDAAAWEVAETVPMEDLFGTDAIGFDDTGATLYMTDSRDRDTAAVFAVDPLTGRRTLLAEDAHADATDILRHPATRRVQAVSFPRQRQRWHVIDPDLRADFDRLAALDDGDLKILSRSRDEARWIVSYVRDTAPQRFFLYDRRRGEATFLFASHQQQQAIAQTLAPMRPAVIPARDGLDLVSYYTLPRDADVDADGVPARPLPTVLLVHGGPAGRDRWGFNDHHQWLADRGYAVLSVNFRGSTGFGKEFIRAAHREWGGKMHDDLVDAVRWAVARRIADPARVASMGWSYGGYASLVGMTFTPELFACGVAVVAPSSLVSLLESAPPHWKPSLAIWRALVGDHTTDHGRAFLRSRSPLTHVDRIRAPLLIGHGANDPRVKKAEADQIVSAMSAKGLPVTYVVYGDEGHGLRRPENRLSFFAVAEAFLSRHLGGRCQPVGEDFSNSSIAIEAGKEHLPGLA